MKAFYSLLKYHRKLAKFGALLSKLIRNNDGFEMWIARVE